jgi:two-component system KDP operon response regulator KdpE
MKEKILIIEDDPDTGDLIKTVFESRGMVATHVLDGHEGLKQVYELKPDLIILDIRMPDLDGFEVCRRIREFSDVPVIMVSAKTQCHDVQRGFAAGADNYVKKPFHNEELLVRVEYLLKRDRNTTSRETAMITTEYSDSVLKMNLDSQKVIVKKKEISLTATEYRLLDFLVRHPYKTLSIRTLLTEVWGDFYNHEKNLLSFYIHQLRKKLKTGDASFQPIRTHRGLGYSYHPPHNNVESRSETKIPSEKTEQPDKARPLLRLKWFWLSLTGLLILLFLVTAQGVFSTAFGYNAHKDHTVIKAKILAEGFTGKDVSGVRGEICIDNIGEYPTANLTIVNTVQIHSQAKIRYISSTVDLSGNPVLGPGKSHCYPFGIAFEPMPEPDAQYRATTTITITNHSGLLPGNKYCPGTEPCPYGPEISTVFTLP